VGGEAQFDPRLKKTGRGEQWRASKWKKKERTLCPREKGPTRNQADAGVVVFVARNGSRVEEGVGWVGKKRQLKDISGRRGGGGGTQASKLSAMK